MVVSCHVESISFSSPIVACSVQLSDQAVDLTLDELKLCPQETLIIEERTS